LYTHVYEFFPVQEKTHDLLLQGAQRYPLIAPPGQPGVWSLRLDWKLITSRCVQEKFDQYLGRINNRHSAQHSQNCGRDVMLKVIFLARSTVTTKCQPARLFYLASYDRTVSCQSDVLLPISSSSEGGVGSV